MKREVFNIIKGAALVCKDRGEYITAVVFNKRYGIEWDEDSGEHYSKSGKPMHNFCPTMFVDRARAESIAAEIGGTVVSDGMHEFTPVNIMGGI